MNSECIDRRRSKLILIAFGVYLFLAFVIEDFFGEEDLLKLNKENLPS